MKERARSLESILLQYEKFVKPAFDLFIWPVRDITLTLPHIFLQTKKYADVVIPRGSENTVAIDLISQHVKHQLDLRSMGQIGK